MRVKPEDGGRGLRGFELRGKKQRSTCYMRLLYTHKRTKSGVL